MSKRKRTGALHDRQNVDLTIYHPSFVGELVWVRFSIVSLGRPIFLRFFLIAPCLQDRVGQSILGCCRWFLSFGVTGKTVSPSKGTPNSRAPLGQWSPLCVPAPDVSGWDPNNTTTSYTTPVEDTPPAVLLFPLEGPPRVTSGRWDPDPSPSSPPDVINSPTGRSSHVRDPWSRLRPLSTRRPNSGRLICH